MKLMDNSFLKLLSLVVALVLWLVIVNINDAETTEHFNNLEVSLLNTEVITENGKVFRVEEGSNIVRVSVRARKSVLRELKPTDFILTADMEKNLKYDSLVGISVKCKNKHINVDEDVMLDRSNVNVSIEDSATEQFQVIVRHTGKENDGLMVGSMVPEQTVIKITGPVSIVERIERVEAVVDVTGLPATSVKNCSLKLLDSAGNQLDPTYLNFIGKNDGIDVTVSMLNKKTIPLIFSYEGEPAENYKIKEVEWKPEFVEIAGNADVLAGMNSLHIPSEVISVEGIDDEQQLVVDITPYLPSGVVLADATNASVLVIIEVEYEKPETEASEDDEDASDKKDTDSDTTPKPDDTPESESTSETETDVSPEGMEETEDSEGTAAPNINETESENNDNTENNS